MHSDNSICGVPVIFVGWFASTLLGIVAACYMDRGRFIKGLHAQVAMARDEVERSCDTEGWSKDLPNSVESVWHRAFPDIRKAAFAALPHLILPYEADRLRTYMRVLSEFDIQAHFDDGLALLAAEISGVPATSKKAALLAALGRLDQYLP